MRPERKAGAPGKKTQTNTTTSNIQLPSSEENSHEDRLQTYQDACLDIRHAEQRGELNARDAFHIATRCTSTLNTVIGLIDRKERASVLNKMAEIIKRLDGRPQQAVDMQVNDGVTARLKETQDRLARVRGTELVYLHLC